MSLGLRHDPVNLAVAQQRANQIRSRPRPSGLLTYLSGSLSGRQNGYSRVPLRNTEGW